jgi:hypothetical protein
MDQKKVLKQMIDFNKTAFDNTFSAMVMLQEQAERSMADTVMDQATWLPEEGKKVIRDWVDAYKTGRDNFKKGVDDSFKKVEAFFAGSK